MESDVACRQYSDRNQNDEVAPVASRHDLSRDNGKHHKQEGTVDQSRNRGTRERGTGDRNASRDPDAKETDERPALKRQPSSPVWNGGQKEAGDDGCKVA